MVVSRQKALEYLADSSSHHEYSLLELAVMSNSQLTNLMNIILEPIDINEPYGIIDSAIDIHLQ